MVGASYIQAIKSVATVMPYSHCSHFLCIALHIPPFPTTIVAICMCIVLLLGTCMHSYSDNVQCEAKKSTCCFHHALYNRVEQMDMTLSMAGR